MKDENNIDCQIDVDRQLIYFRCPKCKMFSIELCMPYNLKKDKISIFSTVVDLLKYYGNWSSICFNRACSNDKCRKLINFLKLAENINNRNKRWIDLLKLQIILESTTLVSLQEEKFLNIRFI